MSEEIKDGAEDPSKLGKEYENMLKLLDSIFTTPVKDLAKKGKAGKSIVGGIIEKISKEKEEALKSKVEEKINSIITGYQKLQDEKAAKLKELKDLETAKMKELISAGNQLMNMVKDFDRSKATWTEGLSTAVGEGTKTD